MKINASAVKEKLQNERDCVIYLYLSGGNFVYDTELRDGCIGKLSSLSLNEKHKKVNEVSKLSETSRIKITDYIRAGSYKNYDVIMKAVIEAVIEHNEDLQGQVVASSLLRDDLGLDSLDVADLILLLQKEMGVSIPDYAVERFDNYGVKIEDVCNYLHLQINQALEKAEQ